MLNKTLVLILLLLFLFQEWAVECQAGGRKLGCRRNFASSRAGLRGRRRSTYIRSARKAQKPGKLARTETVDKDESITIGRN